MQATYTADAAFLADSLFPILRASVNLYRHFSVADQGDGLIHLPPTASPEYPYPHGPTNDTNYDLALFLWGAKTLLDLANATGNGADPLVPYWRSVVATLTPSPADPVHGLNVSLGVGFDIPHRHFSHLFSIYPLHILPFSDKDGGTPATQGLIARSLDRWSGLTCGGGGGGGWACPNGFTYVGVASMSALMGADGDDSRRAAAVGNLSSFVRSGLMHASTLYSEGHQPCIESPLGFASSLMEVLLQSWGGRVRVFPAVPAAWADAVIHNMGAEGGFRVSAARAGGTTQWVGVRAVNYTSSSSSSSSSAAAAPGSSTRTIVLATDMVGPFATSPAGVPVTILPSGDITFPVPVGPDNEADASWVVVFPASGGAPPPFTVQPLAGNSSQYNYWGMH
jgi:alpha-L-fucosidase 2